MAVALAYLNYVDVGGVTASSSLGNMGASQVKTVHVAERWRGATGSEYLTFNIGAAYAFDTIALMGVNLSETGQVRVRISNTDSTAASGDLYDTGMVSDTINPQYKMFVALLPEAVNAQFIRIDLSDLAISAVEVGRAFIGPRVALEGAVSVGWERGHIDLSQRVRSRGGQSYLDRNVSYRTINMTLDFLSLTDRWGIVEDIDRIVGSRDDVLFIPDTTADQMTLSRDALWALQDDQQLIVQPYSFDVFRKSLRLSERL